MAGRKEGRKERREAKLDSAVPFPARANKGTS